MHIHQCVFFKPTICTLYTYIFLFISLLTYLFISTFVFVFRYELVYVFEMILKWNVLGKTIERNFLV